MVGAFVFYLPTTTKIQSQSQLSCGGNHFLLDYLYFYELDTRYVIAEGRPASFIVLDAKNYYDALNQNAAVLASYKEGRKRECRIDSCAAPSFVLIFVKKDFPENGTHKKLKRG